jgi:coenzyme F420-0:L-glutamate ligase/coenzyme F420-1:gamma-L-glutamate ligase
LESKLNGRCQPSAEFWSALDDFVHSCEIIIDRPKGSKHPRHKDLTYPIDYGYLAGTRSADGEGVDIFVGSAPNKDICAFAASVDLFNNDAEIKILVGCTSAESAVIETFLNQHTMHAIIIERVGEQAVLQRILARQSIRKFTQEPVSDLQVSRILKIAMSAPSAHNHQPWRFIVMKSRQARESLARGMGEELRRDLTTEGFSELDIDQQVSRSIERIISAPAAILLCLDRIKLAGKQGTKQYSTEYLMGTQSVAMAGENLLLAAHLLGLGAVWLCAPLFAQAVIYKAIELPPTWDPQGLVLMGYPDTVPPPKTRQSLHEVSVVL